MKKGEGPRMCDVNDEIRGRRRIEREGREERVGK